MKKRFVNLLVIAFAAAFVVIGLHFVYKSGKATALRGVSTFKAAPTVSTLTVPSKNLSAVVNRLNQVIDQQNTEVAVSFVDLDSGKQYDAGETGVVFKAASTLKLLAVVSYMHAVEQGNATLSQNIDGTSAQTLIKRMLEVSDNDAWKSINDYLGPEQASYAQSIGLTTFTGGDYNTISAADDAKLLALLYQGKLIDNEHRAIIYQYMQAADGADLIKAALPADATVYHKYGQLWGNLNDTAIINYQGHNFALVIYTKNDDNTTDDYDSRVALIHQLTTVVFDGITQ